MSVEKPIISAGVIVVNYQNGIPFYLVLRVHNYWDFPKGMVDPGEEPLAGAIREVEEETTLTGLAFRWGYDYRETPPYQNGKIARYYIAESVRTDISLPISEELGHPEHDEFCWLEFESACNLLNQRVRSIFDWARSVIDP